MINFCKYTKSIWKGNIYIGIIMSIIIIWIFYISLFKL